MTRHTTGQQQPQEAVGIRHDQGAEPTIFNYEVGAILKNSSDLHMYATSFIPAGDCWIVRAHGHDGSKPFVDLIHMSGQHSLQIYMIVMPYHFESYTTK